MAIRMVFNPITGRLDMVSDSAPEQSGVFAQDIPVSLADGKTLGRYETGEVVPAAGKTAEEVIRMLAIESVYPKYTIPAIAISQSASTVGEVGEVVINTLTATFIQNDAGALSYLSVLVDGAEVGGGADGTTYYKNHTMVRALVSKQIRAMVNYTAGLRKLVLPQNSIDDRQPLVRNINAPQAASDGFTSGALGFVGYKRLYFGAAATMPLTRAAALALGGSQLTNAGNNFTLNTGSEHRTFYIIIPADKTLVSVVDADAMGVEISQYYTPQSNVYLADAGGNAVNCKVYAMTNAVAYPVNHRHNATIN
jgi:hypothetical protein